MAARNHAKLPKRESRGRGRGAPPSQGSHSAPPHTHTHQLWDAAQAPVPAGHGDKIFMNKEPSESSETRERDVALPFSSPLSQLVVCRPYQLCQAMPAHLLSLCPFHSTALPLPLTGVPMTWFPYHTLDENTPEPSKNIPRAIFSPMSLPRTRHNPFSG